MQRNDLHEWSRRGADCFSLLVVACALVACKSPSQYVSPRVEGRVVDAQSHQPIRDVQVRWLSTDESYRIEKLPGDGATIADTPAVHTARNGAFVLESERELALVHNIEWYSVNLLFQHPAYETFMATYTWIDSTNIAKRKPLVEAGEILLIPIENHR